MAWIGCPPWVIGIGRLPKNDSAPHLQQIAAGEAVTAAVRFAQHGQHGMAPVNGRHLRCDGWWYSTFIYRNDSGAVENMPFDPCHGRSMTHDGLGRRTGGEQKVRFGFTVEHPREAAVAGL
jgi:hypothetical protein